MPTPPIPSYDSTTIDGRNVFVNDLIDPRRDAVTLDATNADSGATPTYRLRPGNVLLLDISEGNYREATDATADVSSAAAITTSSHSDGNGAIVIVGNHGTISVTTATGSGTEANNVTDLNADAEFAAHYVATSGAGELTITSLATGAGEYFYMDSSTMATASFAEGTANGVHGITGDYRVLLEHTDMQDEDGTATDADAEVAWTGHFDESQLINLTPEARGVFLARGAHFG